MPIRMGQVTLDSGNLYLDIPLYSRSARGMPAAGSHLYYNSQFWHPAPITGGGTYPVDPGNGGWSSGRGPSLDVQVQPRNVETQSCPAQYPYGNIQEFESWIATEANGTLHQFFTNTQTYDIDCVDYNGNAWVPGAGYPTESGASDGNGFYIDVNKNIATVYSSNGSILTGPTLPAGPESPNGNYSIFFPATGGGAKDTLGSLIDGVDSCQVSNFSETAYLNDTPYKAQDPITCTLSVPSWDGASNATVSYSITNSYIPVCTAFFPANQSAGDFCGGIWVVTNIGLPDGTSYSFTYDQGTTSGHFGLLTGITLPTGGNIQVGYSILSPSTNGPLNLFTTVHTVTDNGGQTTIDSTLSGGSRSWDGTLTLYPVTVTYPAHQLSPKTPAVTDQSLYSIATATTNGVSSTTLTKVDKLAGTTVRSTSMDYTFPQYPSFSQTTWSETGDTLRTDYTYSNGQPADRKQTLNGAEYRTLHTDYLGDTATTPYVSQYHMVSYPSRVQILDASKNPIAETDYTYDEYSSSYCGGSVPMLTTITGATGHDDSRGANFVARGNPTTIKSLTSGGNTVTTHRCYDTLGNVTGVVDGNGGLTKFDYTDNFADRSCVDPNTSTYALPTTVVDPLGHTTKTSYNSCLRQPVTVADPNDIASSRTGTTTTYDSAGRQKCVTTSDGGRSCTIYQPSSASTYQQTQLVSPGAPAHSVTTNLDGFGNLQQTIDQQSGIEVDYSYDGSGRLYTQSLPHFSGAATSATTFFYDGLGRNVYQLQSDGTSAVKNSYVGLYDYKTDEAGNQWTYAMDPLQRLSIVAEGASLTAPNTSYTYDLLSNLHTVIQSGQSGGSDILRSRTYTYDGLSRLLTATNPETGTVCYGTLQNGSCIGGYDGNGNLRAKTDARGLTTNFFYDAGNRLTSKTYTGSANGVDPTPSSCFLYDVMPGGSAVANATGRLVAEWTQAGSCSPANGGVPSSALNWTAIHSYDSLGRVMEEQQCSVAPCSDTVGTLNWTYDLAGNVTSSTNGAGTSGSFGIGLRYGFDGASRLASVTSSWDTDQSHPHTLFSADASVVTSPYGPFGLTNAQLGIPLNGSPLLSRLREYDTRGRVIHDKYSATAVTASGSQPSNSSHAQVISISPNPVASGVTAIAVTACDDTCGSGDGGFYVDGNLINGFTFAPGQQQPNQVPNNLNSQQPHSLYVSYTSSTGDTFTSPIVPFTVSNTVLPDPQMTVTVKPAPVPQGEMGEVEITLTACGSNCGSGVGYFTVDGNFAGGFQIDGDGDVITYTSTALTADTHHLIVYWQGSESYSASSKPVDFVVAPNSLPLGNTTPTITPSTGILSGEYGSVTISNSCQTSCGGGQYFVDGNYSGGYVLDDSGNAVVPIYPGLTTDTHYLTVSYFGNAEYKQTQTDAIPFQVIENDLFVPTFTVNYPSIPVDGSNWTGLLVTLTPPATPVNASCQGQGAVFVDGQYSDTFFVQADNTVIGNNGGNPLLKPLGSGTHNGYLSYFGNGNCKQTSLTFTYKAQ